MRNTLVVGCAAAAALVAASLGGTAWAGVAQSSPTQEVHVCATNPRPGFAACMAIALAGPNGKVVRATSPLAGGFTPAMIEQAYDLTGLKSGGATVAIVDAGGYADLQSDLAYYRSYYGLPACTEDNGCLTVMNQTGGSTLPPSQGWEDEEALDLDSVSAACPDCKILMVQANSSSFSDLEAAEDTAAGQPGVVAINNSYGGKGADQADNKAYNHPGIAVVASGGDDGYQGTPGYPSSDNHVVAVGGTSLVANGSKRGYSESVWGSSSGGEGTGSGCTTLNRKPKWQDKADTTCSDRAANDVAAAANPSEGGLAVYLDGAWEQIGGTSEAAPLVSAVFALSGNTAGYPAKNLYKESSRKHLYDITTGANGDCGTVLCTAGKGWDGPTGNGTPHGSQAF